MNDWISQDDLKSLLEPHPGPCLSRPIPGGILHLRSARLDLSVR